MTLQIAPFHHLPSPPGLRPHCPLHPCFFLLPSAPVLLPLGAQTRLLTPDLGPR